MSPDPRSARRRALCPGPLSVLLVALGCGACGFDFADQPGRLVDESYADFAAGTPQEAGAKMLISRAGRVELIDRLDLNGDGWIDLPLSTFRASDGTAETQSRLLWGGKAGFADERGLALPGSYATFNAAGDFDGDGFPELVVSSLKDAGTSRLYARVFAGTVAGLDPARRTDLPAVGAMGLAVADLDRDGYLDLTVANNYEMGGGPGSHALDSYIYWGGPGGLASTRRSGLATVGASGLSCGDLDDDGHLDLVVTSLEDGARRDIDSYIYWGAGDRSFAKSRRTALPSVGGVNVTLADLDQDGHLDLVLVNMGHFQKWPFPSYIYWGAGDRSFGKSRRSEPQTSLATAATVADLNRDGHLDLVFNNGGRPTDGKNTSYIYWGPWKRDVAPQNVRLELPTSATSGVQAADFNRDGHLDLVFFSRDKAGSPLYAGPWSAASGTITKTPQFITGHQAYVSRAIDAGTLHRRLGRQRFVSRVFDTGRPAPRYAVLSWQAKTPARTALSLQLRSASSPQALAAAPWQGPTGKTDAYQRSPARINATAHEGHRYLQYRATLESQDHGTTPYLQRVEISFR